MFGDLGEKPPVFIVHGLFGSARNWYSVAKKLCSRLSRPVIALDLRNHGSSFWSKEHSYELMSEDLFRVIQGFGGKGDFIGHSMGGKVVMSLALLHPEVVSKLIVVDIAPIKYMHQQVENLDAMSSININLLKTRSEADIQLKEFGMDLNHRAFLLQNLSRNVDGSFEWKLNIDALRTNINHIMAFPKYEQQYLGPSFFLRSYSSGYISCEGERAVKKFFPNYDLQTITNCGHWIHSEKPTLFIDKASFFLSD